MNPCRVHFIHVVVTWCFTPSQPLWLYQGKYISCKLKTKQTKKVTSKHNININIFKVTTVKLWQMKMNVSGCIWGLSKLNAWSVWKTGGMTTFKDLLSYAWSVWKTVGMTTFKDLLSYAWSVWKTVGMTTFKDLLSYAWSVWKTVGMTTFKDLPF